MTDTARTTMSLRDIALELGLAPSTVVYYRDRFSDYLPEPVLVGRRRRYPPEAVGAIRLIREMYAGNRSTEAIREALADGMTGGNGDGPVRLEAGGEPSPEGAVHQAPRAGGPDAPPPPRETEAPQGPQPMRDISDRLGEMARLLGEQGEFRAELAALRRELDEARGEARDERARHEAELAEARAELERIQRQRDFMERYILKSIQRDNIFHSSPSGVFLDLPLVVRSSGGEYLGVSGKAGQAFSVRSLVSLLQSNTNARMDIRIRWERAGDSWALRVDARDREAEKDQDLQLTLHETVTPSRNIVAQLTAMVVDGKATPDKYIMALFKQFKDSLD